MEEYQRCVIHQLQVGRPQVEAGAEVQLQRRREAQGPSRQVLVGPPQHVLAVLGRGPEAEALAQGLGDDDAQLRRVHDILGAHAGPAVTEVGRLEALHVAVGQVDGGRPAVLQRDERVALEEQPPDAPPHAFHVRHQGAVLGVAVHAHARRRARRDAQPVPGVGHDVLGPVGVPGQQQRGLDYGVAVPLEPGVKEALGAPEKGGLEVLPVGLVKADVRAHEQYGVQQEQRGRVVRVLGLVLLHEDRLVHHREPRVDVSKVGAQEPIHDALFGQLERLEGQAIGIVACVPPRDAVRREMRHILDLFAKLLAHQEAQIRHVGPNVHGPGMPVNGPLREMRLVDELGQVSLKEILAVVDGRLIHVEEIGHLHLGDRSWCRRCRRCRRPRRARRPLRARGSGSCSCAAVAASHDGRQPDGLGASTWELGRGPLALQV